MKQKPVQSFIENKKKIKKMKEKMIDEDGKF